MSDVTQLRELLGLAGVKQGDLKFQDFLLALKDHPEYADTAASMLIRAIESRGEVEIDTAPPERRPYLRMLAKMRVSSWKAFDHIKGSQRTVALITEHLYNASQNGLQLRLAIMLKGGPASGKGALAMAIKDTLEGELVHSVSGCPVHENPINLLTLLPPDRLESIAKAIGMGDEESKKADKTSLRQLVATAGRPCHHCWTKVMGEGDKLVSEPNLGDVMVEHVRLSSRNFGISTWSGQETLLSVLKRGSRGVVDMPEIFSLGALPGSTNPELDLLLEATNDRRIPGMGSNEIGIPGSPLKLANPNAVDTGWMPLDAILIGQTNDGAWDAFMAAQKDKDKFTRRMAIIQVPYNTSVTEEEAAYRDHVNAMRDQPHFDPMALKLLALTAVVSRMKVAHDVDVVTRARMYDGEQLRVEKKPKTTATTSGSAASTTSTGTAGTLGSTEKAYWHVGEFWQDAGADEGMFGLNMSDMFKIVSEITEAALDSKHKSVSAIGMINYLRGRVAEMKKQPSLTDKQKEVLKAVEEYLKAPKGFNDKEVGLIEKEYRRVLVRQLFEVASPDFDRRATELYERYRRHAKAFSIGDRELTETVIQAGVPSPRKVKVDVDFLNEMDRWMGMTADKDREAFRRSIETRIGLATQMKLEDDDEGVKSADLIITWESIQEIADGIRKKLNSEIAKTLENLLKSEIELDEEQKKLRRETLERFDKLGYNDYTRQQALTYFRDYKLWIQG
ncbi:serine/threonine protein kinase PrkA [soil metagenome]